MPTREQLIAAIRVKPLIINNCSVCAYPCAFEFQGDKFGYDSGCDCVSGPLYLGWQPRPVEELDFYLDPQHGWEKKLTTFMEGVSVGKT